MKELKGYLLATLIALVALPATFAGFPQGGIIATNAVHAAETKAVKEVAPKAEEKAVQSTEVKESEVKEIDWFNKLVDWAKNSAGFIAGLLVALEVGLRLFPTVKPKSILLPAKYIVDGLLVVLGVLSNFIVAAINVANKSETKLPPTV